MMWCMVADKQHIQSLEKNVVGFFLFVFFFFSLPACGFEEEG